MQANGRDYPTPRTNHLIVTSAGANCFTVYEPRPHYFGMQWSQSPVVQVIAHDDEEVQDVNTADKMEGGPKGAAIHENNLAVCSPQIGVKIYCFREQRGWFGRRGQRLKGLGYGPTKLQRVDTRVRFDMAGQKMSVEWHQLEIDPKYGSFRWTGPSPRATINLPIMFDRDLAVRIHILSTIEDDSINALRVSIHDRDTPYRLNRLPEGTFLVLAQLIHAAIAKSTREFGITLEIICCFPSGLIDVDIFSSFRVSWSRYLRSAIPSKNQVNTTTITPVSTSVVKERIAAFSFTLGLTNRIPALKPFLCHLLTA